MVQMYGTNEVIIQILSSIAVRSVSSIAMNYTCLDVMEQPEYHNKLARNVQRNDQI